MTEWPDSQFVEEEDLALRYLYRWTPQVQTILASAPPPSWANPHLPEDPHLLRSDGTLLLGSTALHDRVWLQLTTTELDALQADPSASGWLESLNEEPPGLAAQIRSYLDDDEIGPIPDDPSAEVQRNTWAFGHDPGDDPDEVAAAIQDTAVAVSRRFNDPAAPYTFYVWYDAQSGHLKCSLTSQEQLPFRAVVTEVNDPAIIVEQALRDTSPEAIPLSEFSTTPPPGYTEDPEPLQVWVNRPG